MLPAGDHKIGDRQEDPETARTTLLRPRTQGRSVPIPPVIPTVVIVSLVLGLVVGFGLASKPGPPPVPSVPAFAASPPASPSPPANRSVASTPAVIPVGEAPTATPFELPPTGGLTLAQALATLKGAAVGTDSPSDVISARIARYGEVASGALPADRWVWAFVVRAFFDPASCGARPSPEPCTPSATTELAIFDYQTGEFLEDRLPASP